MKEITIFYSWQSDLPSECNQKTIRDILKKAKARIESEHPDSINIKIDEATQDEIGSPNIPQTIIKKISNSDIFIGDVSIINKNSDSFRKTPNPNVMFELGFASSRLGWERVILLFNNAFGTLDDLPFDIDRHRITPYNIEENCDASILNSKIGTYSNDLYTFIKRILDYNPKKPVKIQTMDPKEIKRNKDIEHIKEFLQCMQIEIIDNHIKNIPNCIDDDIWFFYYRLESIAHSSRFNLYNKDLYSCMVNYWTSLDETLNYSECYNPTNNGSRYIWHNPGDMPLSEEKQKIWDNIKKARGNLHYSLRNILEIIREDYLEIDIDKISELNYKEFIKYKRENQI